ncbi:lipocalin family protein [Leadbetterella byssophila]|uniref:Outer membrane lipoprotein Blc n=1 Tax=Leadbetterella byssophila (strain DSM 17132 / JCM 16389 / KACC 11308 / NBRC 106382 / 4M15) TaxID=649349 RepID=E4RTT5_LEAB4|nr:lipocalin family protein [Leadbetterella byssophila]ADQ17809.1 Lipocalin family protein [Leadbetterella byssophila DSM 17132]
MIKKTFLYFLSVGMLFLHSCKAIPEKATPVQNFELSRYLGKWYEIARLDIKFEKGLDHTTASYSLKSDGSVKVVNRGYDIKKDKWKEAIGKAKFRGEESVGALMVSFFGPFYSGYNVIALDDDYQYALVAGKDLDYLWILSRTTELPGDVKENFLRAAEDIGYNTQDLIWVNQK